MVVSMRKWAALDPNSIFYGKEVPSAEKIISSGMVSSPLHRRECNVLADGGGALLVISIWNLYMAYPVGHTMFMEAVGLCEPGQAGKVFMEGRTCPGGNLPWATIGDAVGRGHTGSGVSMATYIETARQLMGKAGKRQVSDAKYVFQNTAGGSGMNFIATVWGRELS